MLLPLATITLTGGLLLDIKIERREEEDTFVRSFINSTTTAPAANTSNYQHSQHPIHTLIYSHYTT